MTDFEHSRAGARNAWTRATAPERPFVVSLRAAASRALEERRYFCLVPFAIIAGVVLALDARAEPDPAVLAGVAAGLVVALLLARGSLAWLRLVGLAAAVWFGVCLPFLHGTAFGTPMLSHPSFGTYEMRVDEIVSEDGEARRVIVSAITPGAHTRTVPVRRARIVVNSGPAFEPGDTIRGRVRFYPVPGAVLPGGFDSRLHAYFGGVGAYGTATEAPVVVALGDPSAPERVIASVRRTLAERINAALDQPAAGIARALVIGDRSGVPREDRTMMGAAGLAHVLAISGLHLSLVAGGVFVVLRMALAPWAGIGRFVSVKRLAAAGGIVAALAYFSISGGSVAAMRATIMIVLVFGAVVAGRRALTMRNVALAGLVVIVTDPASVLRPSFQLSFSAVIALIGAWELTRHRYARDRDTLERFFGYFVGIVSTSFIAGIATLLFSIYHFQQTAPLGILGNLLAMPIVAFVTMPAGFFAALLTPFGLEAPFFVVMGWSVERVLELSALVAAWSRPIDASPLLGPVALLLAAGALAWFAFLPTWHRLLGPVLLIPAVVLFGLDRAPDVLVSDTTQAVAVRGDEGLALVAGRANTFAVNVWSETYREAIPAQRAACEDGACVTHSSRAFGVAIVTEDTGFAHACDADLLISRNVAVPPDCRPGLVLDAAALAEGGAHWLAWDAGRGRFEVRTVNGGRNRPWRPMVNATP